MFRPSETLHYLDFEASQFPQKFTYPFNYEPHAWVEQAAVDVQKYLENNTDLNYKFGFDDANSLGKMFGVLIVETEPGNFAYLAAFSGKLNNTNFLSGFVPPIFDLLDPNSFFRKGEEDLNQLNQQIKTLEQSKDLEILKTNLTHELNLYNEQVKKLKDEHKQAKIQRSIARNRLDKLEDDVRIKKELDVLKNESIHQHYELKKYKKEAKAKIALAEEKLNQFLEQIEELKNARQKKSASLQQRLHEQYTFLNANGETASLTEVFEPYKRIPPAGAGECAAPRLLNYAYQNGWKPIAMGEFWWGASPSSEIREHRNFYPACKSRCEPILSFMLQGLNVETNPVLNLPTQQILDIIYEDDYLMLVNKPTGLLSVPGKTITACLWQQVIDYLNDNTEVTLVHRLDMSTSGIVLIAKTLEIYKKLQQQFIQRKVQKSYTAILDGIVTSDKGEINLPLRVDLDNRPMQLVCYEYGKAALTHYRVLARNIKNKTTRIQFFPFTGRTHQLRVHAAHKLGLHAPIVGDELYGKRNDRLYLHATTLSFLHPILSKKMKFSCTPPF